VAPAAASAPPRVASAAAASVARRAPTVVPGACGCWHEGGHVSCTAACRTNACAQACPACMARVCLFLSLFAALLCPHSGSGPSQTAIQAHPSPGTQPPRCPPRRYRRAARRQPQRSRRLCSSSCRGPASS
jgi:hypothetical protein